MLARKGQESIKLAFLVFSPFPYWPALASWLGNEWGGIFQFLPVFPPFSSWPTLWSSWGWEKEASLNPPSPFFSAGQFHSPGDDNPQWNWPDHYTLWGLLYGCSGAKNMEQNHSSPKPQYLIGIWEYWSKLIFLGLICQNLKNIIFWCADI